MEPYVRGLYYIPSVFIVRKFIQWRMDEALMKVDFDTVFQKCGSSQLCPFLGVVTMVMADDYPFRRRILHGFQNILTEALC